jgi:hypothetical protein
MEISVRMRFEPNNKLKHLGFVSTLPELSSHGWTTGNAYQQNKRKFTCANLDDMAKTSGFLNQKQASVAVIE